MSRTPTSTVPRRCLEGASAREGGSDAASHSCKAENRPRSPPRALSHTARPAGPPLLTMPHDQKGGVAGACGRARRSTSERRRLIPVQIYPLLENAKAQPDSTVAFYWMTILILTNIPLHYTLIPCQYQGYLLVKCPWTGTSD